MQSSFLDAVAALARSAPPALATPLANLRRLAGKEAEEKRQLEEQLGRYQLVLGRALEVTVTRGLGPVADKVIDGMLEVAGANRGFVGLAEESGRWSLLVARNMEHADVPDPESKLSTSIIAEVLRTGQPLVTENARQEEGLEQAQSVFRLRLRSVACLPLVHNERSIGFVYLDDARSEGLFDEAALTAVRAWLPLAAEAVARAQKESLPTGPLGLPTRSTTLLADLERLERVARFDASILLTGETGTGKSMLARKVHEAGPRSQKPFVHVNCGALPEALLEGELFGAEAGAYTGSKGAREGRFEAAHGGSLFLDELDTMPLGCQVKLLVALQERQVTRLGSNRPIVVDVRVMAAMSTDPRQAIAEGKLREDLYYRLAVIEVRLPALRERAEDIPLLARSLLQNTQQRYGLPPLRLTASALDQLCRHAWPGNVRELQNALDRAALFSENGEIREVPLPGAAPAVQATTLLGALQAAARRYVEELSKNPKLRRLELLDGFRGMVVAEAVRRLGGRDEAMAALGEGEMVENRNHHRVIRRELDRLAALEAAAG